MESFKRHDGRTPGMLRPVNLTYDALGYADASLLFQIGSTKVLVSVTLAQGVPQFLKGQRVGWLSAEYAMLPCATQQRTNREISQLQRNFRSVEISRLIGRCLRTAVDLASLGERTITIDCDVLQADGSTRVACVTAASFALALAMQRWYEHGITERNLFKGHVVGVSAGVIAKVPCLDISYAEDSNAHADFNFILSQQGNIIEIQGTGEKEPVSWDQFEQLGALARAGAAQLLDQCLAIPMPSGLPAFYLQDNQPVQRQSAPSSHTQQKRPAQQSQTVKPGFFSLAQRLNNKSV